MKNQEVSTPRHCPLLTWRQMWTESLPQSFPDSFERSARAVCADMMCEDEARAYAEVTQVMVSQSFRDVWQDWTLRRTRKASALPVFAGLGVLAVCADSVESVFGYPYGSQTAVGIQKVFGIVEILTTQSGCGELAVLCQTSRSDADVIAIKTIAC